MSEPEGSDVAAMSTPGAALAPTDDCAFTALYDAHARSIHDLFVRALHDHALAEDLTQTVFVRAYAQRATLTDARRSKAWLFVVASNLARAQFSRRRPQVTLDEVAELAAAGAGVEDTVAARETAELVWEAVGSLEPHHRLVLDLRHRRGLSIAEVAQALETTPGRASDLMARANEGLRTAVRSLLVRRQAARCPGLRDLLDGAEEAFTPQLRRTVDRHMRRCIRCQQLADRLTAPGELYGGLTLLSLPTALAHFSPGWTASPHVAALASLPPAPPLPLPPPPPPGPPVLPRRRIGWGVGGGVATLGLITTLVVRFDPGGPPVLLSPAIGTHAPAVGIGAPPGGGVTAGSAGGADAAYVAAVDAGWRAYSAARDGEGPCSGATSAVPSCLAGLDATQAVETRWQASMAAIAVPAGYADRHRSLLADIAKDLAARPVFRAAEVQGVGIGSGGIDAYLRAQGEILSTEGAVDAAEQSILICLTCEPTP